MSEVIDAVPKRNPRAAAVIGIAIVGCLAILVALLVSVERLYNSLGSARSIYDIDVKSLAVTGDLQYQIQESRRRFLSLLISEGEGAQGLDDIHDVRKADLQVSLLAGRVALLTHDLRLLEPFSTAWNRYTDVRDDMIALALEGRTKEALRLEHDRGHPAFELASIEIQQAKAALEASSERKVTVIWEALRRACFEVLGLLAAAIVLVAAALGGEISRMRILGHLRTALSTLRESELRFRSLFDEAAVGILILNSDGTVVHCNKAITDVTGQQPQELIDKPVWDIMADTDRLASREAVARLAAGAIDSYRTERRLQRPDGAKSWIRASVSTTRRDDAPTEVIVLCENITEQKNAQEQLRYQATHDALTGLANRRSFEAELERVIGESGATAGAIGLLYIDLDGFKLVNDTLGHAAGDLLLRDLAGRFASALNPDEFVARLGGDEFAIIRPLRAGESKAALEQIAERLLGCINTPFLISARHTSVGASIGISCFPEDGEGVEQLLQSADAAMYHAKRSGRGYYLFDAEMREANRRRIRIQSALVEALKREEFWLAYQPLYDAATGELGRWILEKASLDAKPWQIPGGSAIRLAVNVSAVQFAREDFVSGVAEILAKTGFPAQLLELELTEGVLVRDREESISKMHLLRNMGIGISIDDFGTGYSLLSYLQMMPVDALKIDRSFTARLDSSETAITMVRSVIAMGRTLGLRVVTEGVENREQLDIVRRLGSDEVQGYFLGRAEVVEATLERVLASRATSESAAPADDAAGAYEFSEGLRRLSLA